ncbi:MAG TPA: RagB/SusD family nutrient uptake outer membrane protein [Bacteroidales bacterium]|jgi:hypothetical protein|nr:RagB/SusD family nutrient uptake outer membrane protein [Bacteroidales bacterium]
MKVHKIFIAFFTGILAILSCDADKLELSNPNELDPSTYFKTPAQVQAAVNACYANLQTTGLYSRVMFFGYDNMAYENSGNSQLESDKRQYLDYSFDPSHGAIGAYWESCYRGINKCNFVINNDSLINAILPSVLSQELKDKFIGEARFLRAFYYFLLVTRFGDVPLETEIPTPTSIGKERTPKEQIWNLIKEDLTFASTYCLENADEEDGRVTSGAAYALLGKSHLYLQEYDEALAAFNNIYGDYALGNFEDNFIEETEHGVEHIFDVEFDYALGDGDKWNSDRAGAGLNEVTFRGQEYGWHDWFNVYPSDNLLDEFEAGDPRYAMSFYSNGDSYAGGVVAIPSGRRAGWRKYQNYYKMANENMASGINFRVIRYADVLLMMAEAEANRPGGDLATAIDFMNEVRTRPGVDMPPYPTAEYPITNLDEFMVALEHERKVELAGEQVRINDLVRWGRLKSFIENEIWPNLSSNDRAANLWKDGKELWPIPQAEIDANESLDNTDQNPAYQ